MSPQPVRGTVSALRALLVILFVAIATPVAPATTTPLFQSGGTFGTGDYYPISIASADVNGDGNIDLLVAHLCGPDCERGAVDVRFGHGDGTFEPPVSYDSGGASAEAVVAGDLNGDGHQDIILVNCGPVGLNTCFIANANNGLVGVLLGNGDGTFQPVVTYDSGGTAGVSVLTADLNGDGNLDIAVANSCDTSVTCIHGSIGVLFGAGDGTFAPATVVNTGYDIRDLAIGDVNGDGAMDLAWSSGGNNHAGVLLGNRDGTFQPETVYLLVGIGGVSIALADINNDAALDMLVATHCSTPACTSGSVNVFVGNGDGSFQPPVSYESAGDAIALAVSDVNQDGAADVLIANSHANTVAVLLGLGNGAFESPLTYDSGGTFATAVEAVDLNRDAAPDLVVTNVCDVTVTCQVGVMHVLLNTSARASVRIDIKPGDPDNKVNPLSHSVIQVAVTGSASFDVSIIDLSTVRFGPSEASAIEVHTRDIDGDGYLDAVFQFRIDATGIPCGGSSATLIGSTSNGRRFQGTDAIATLGCRGR